MNERLRFPGKPQYLHLSRNPQRGARGDLRLFGFTRAKRIPKFSTTTATVSAATFLRT
jgi:hypothetical protein